MLVSTFNHMLCSKGDQMSRSGTLALLPASLSVHPRVLSFAQKYLLAGTYMHTHAVYSQVLHAYALLVLLVLLQLNVC